MSWLGEVEGATPLERLFAQRPELLRRYKAFYASLWEGGVPPRRVLELCRLRIAAVHGCAQEWAVRDAGVHLSAAEAAALEAGECACFPPPEQAALAVAEQFPFQHHEIDDAAVAEVQAAFGAEGAVALLIALAFFDVTCRWKLTLAAQQALRAHYSDPEIAEIALGVGLFLGMSKVLINLGLEPEDMPVTVLPTPGNLRPKAAF